MSPAAPLALVLVGERVLVAGPTIARGRERRPCLPYCWWCTCDLHKGFDGVCCRCYCRRLAREDRP